MGGKSNDFGIKKSLLLSSSTKKINRWLSIRFVLIFVQKNKNPAKTTDIYNILPQAKAWGY